MDNISTISPEATDLRNRLREATDPETQLKWHLDEAKASQSYSADLVAALLSLSAESDVSKPLKKAVRKGLFLLGVKEGEPDVGQPSSALVEPATTWKAWMSSSDGGGACGVYLARPDGPLTYRLLFTMVEDGKGIRDADEERFSVHELDEHLDRIRERHGAVWLFGPVPVPYAKWRVLNGIEDGRLAGNRAPSVVAFWSAALKDGASEIHPADALTLPEPDVENPAERSLTRVATLGWMYELAAMNPLLQSLSEIAKSNLEMEDHVKDQRWDVVIGQETEKMFTEQVAKQYMTRLKDLAVLEAENGDLSGAAVSMAAVKDIESNGATSQFARTLTKKSLVYAIEAMKRAR